MSKNIDTDWWKGAVIYQIYPRSFRDSNGDGIGDLPGITEKLDYIRDLGADGIWICPFFKSPMKDFGYDVADYCDVDPIFGTLDDFKRLMEKAKKLDLKVITDQVVNHTSDQHPWFKDSESSKIGDKSDWYVWADPKEDGTAPTNWLSKFGGPAWNFNMRRGQYYLHTFLPSMPDLNLHNPEVQDAFMDNMKFWLDLGVDGFRFDSVLFCMHDRYLKDNPHVPRRHLKPIEGRSFIEPYAMQDHVYDFNQPEALGFINRLRKLMDQHPGTFMVGEVSGTFSEEQAADLSAKYSEEGKYFHTVYNFSFLGDAPTPDLFRQAVENSTRHGIKSWPSWALTNHDVSRTITRWNRSNDPAQNREMSKTLNALLCSLYGTPFLYQGDELGLPDFEVPYHLLQDPLAVYLWPEWKYGRDGGRSPLPWAENDAEKTLDTDKAFNWLPVPPEHVPYAIEHQENDPDSVLNFTKAFLKWRKQHPALIHGEITFVDHSEKDIVCFMRAGEKETLLCLFNLSGTAIDMTIPVAVNDLERIENIPFTGTWEETSHELTLPAYGFCFLSMASLNKNRA
ncbi:MAG: alpha-glucosidase [Rhodospirillales bacterium]|nr:alpha-glucosidase [Rhodospirillales bacterium]